MFCCLTLCVDILYDEKKKKERQWEKKQDKLKDIEEARKKQESELNAKQNYCMVKVYLYCRSKRRKRYVCGETYYTHC